MLIREDEVIHFDLEGLLQSGQALAFNEVTGTLALLTVSESKPREITERLLTPAEQRLLLPVLEAYPNYCPFEVSLASFDRGNTSEHTVAQARQLLNDAQGNQAEWDVVMRPQRNVMSRVRLKVRAMGFDIGTIVKTGYFIRTMNRERG